MIPARGGSKGIPRKNLRFLDGKPLVLHVVDIAKEFTDFVAVTTDDEEIRAVCEQHGVAVVQRPPELALDDTPLDPVVIHAWRTIESLKGKSFHWVITVQPTSPLVSSASLKEAMTKVEQENADCCVAVTDARHLYWSESAGGIPVPAYTARLNRQYLPPFWKETGAIVISSRRVLEAGTRLGGQVCLYPMPPEESLDIDSYDDFIVAQSRLFQPKVAIRVVGNRELGLGHVYRMLTIASRLFTPVLDFYVDASSRMAGDLIRRRHFPVIDFADEEEFIEAVRLRNYTLVINDILDTEASYIRALRGDDERVVISFEDLGSGASETTLTINDLYEYSVPVANQLYGWQYVCLRDEFLLAPVRPFNPKAENLLITFGGTDPSGLTLKALSAAFKVLEPHQSITVVVGPGNRNLNRICDRVAQGSLTHPNVSLLTDVPRMSDVMIKADLALTSNGRTVFELACCRVPMITMSQNSREATHTFGRLSRGAIDLGLGSSVDEHLLTSTLARVWNDSETRRSMYENLSKFDLRSGIERVVNAILDVHRKWRSSHRR
ncbi:MAG TPA: NTP transferase domain-containing protein [Clostridia bacterium]|nr:NTP transferase domain-containing protein [Clostridia bacterium]